MTGEVADLLSRGDIVEGYDASIAGCRKEFASRREGDAADGFDQAYA